MMKRVRSYKSLTAVAALAAGIAAGATSAKAVTILSDDFNADTAVLNWGGDSVFASSGATLVDLVGGAVFGALVNGLASGNAVDLNGTTGSQGALTSKTSLAAGTYTLTFLLAGVNPGNAYSSRAGDTATTTVTVGGVTIGAPFSPGNSDPYTLESITFATSGGVLKFAESNSTNNFAGDMLDDVLVSQVSPGIPEPSTWAMMVLGFLGLGFAGYRKKTNTRLALRG